MAARTLAHTMARDMAMATAAARASRPDAPAARTAAGAAERLCRPAGAAISWVGKLGHRGAPPWTWDLPQHILRYTVRMNGTKGYSRPGASHHFPFSARATPVWRRQSAREQPHRQRRSPSYCGLLPPFSSRLEGHTAAYAIAECAESLSSQRSHRAPAAAAAPAAQVASARAHRRCAGARTADRLLRPYRVRVRVPGAPLRRQASACVPLRPSFPESLAAAKPSL